MTSNRKDGQFPYVKLFPEEYLGGSLHFGCSLEEQGFFVNLLCLAAKNRKERGTLSLEKGKPMTTTMIANAMFIDEPTCARLLKVMEKQERIEHRKDGVIIVSNFEFYQRHYRVARKHDNKDKLSVDSEKAITRKMASKYPESAIYGVQHREIK